jgi:hypothetical protein
MGYRRERMDRDIRRQHVTRAKNRRRKSAERRRRVVRVAARAVKAGKPT